MSYDEEDEYYDDESEDTELEEDEVEQEQRPFNASDYTNEMAATLGVALSSEVIAECLRANDARAINRILMGVPKVAVVQSVAIDDEAKALFKELLSHRNTAHAQSLERDINAYIQNANGYMTNVRNNLANAAQRRTELEQYLKTQTKDMSEEVAKVVADGWYEYDHTKTVGWNNSNNEKSLWFKTAPITLSYYKPSIGIDIKVDMGRYYVRYVPHRNQLAVLECEGNIRSRQDYYHPHVSSSGDVCWGNGADRVTRALNQYNLVEAMGVLRTLLQTYNEESPYATIQTFNEIVNPLSRAPRPAHFQLYGNKTVWMYNRYLPNVQIDGIMATLSNGYFANGEHAAYPATRIQVYRMLFIDNGQRVADTPYYVKDKQGRFHPIQDRYIKYWPASDEQATGSQAVQF